MRSRSALPVASQRSGVAIGTQECAHDLAELVRREGLAHDVVRPLDAVRAGAEDDDGNRGMRGVVAQPVDELAATHHRHHHVGYQKVDPLFADPLECSRAVMGLHHLVALQLEDQADHPTQVRLVIDDQYAGHACSAIPRAAQGQAQLEAAALAHFRSGVHVAAVEACQLPAEEETEPHAARVGGQIADAAEPIEEAAQILVVDSAALIGDLERGLFAVQLQGAGDGRALRLVLDGIGNEVADDAVKPDRIGQDR